MNFNTVDLKVENRVGCVTIHNEPVNALNSETLSGLNDCLDYISTAQEIKAVMITGKGRFFVAGADIKELTSAFGDKEKAAKMSIKGQALMDKIEYFHKPVIAAINGACLGGGLELAMSCHIRIAAHEANLGLPELKLGVIPGYAGTQRLSRLTNKAKALELILTGKLINGMEAERIGLVNYSVNMEDLLFEAKKLAEDIALNKSAISISAAMEAIVKGAELTLQEGQKLEAEKFGELFLTEDIKEGINAFLEKRKAEFKDN